MTCLVSFRVIDRANFIYKLCYMYDNLLHMALCYKYTEAPRQSLIEADY